MSNKFVLALISGLIGTVLTFTWLGISWYFRVNNTLEARGIVLDTVNSKMISIERNVAMLKDMGMARDIKLADNIEMTVQILYKMGIVENIVKDANGKILSYQYKNKDFDIE